MLGFVHIRIGGTGVVRDGRRVHKLDLAANLLIRTAELPPQMYPLARARERRTKRRDRIPLFRGGRPR